MPRLYRYLGPPDLLAGINRARSGQIIRTLADVAAWLEADTKPTAIQDRTATFVIDLDGYLRLADRHSEHVVCAGGSLVLSAGELTISFIHGALTVTNITNQSTGYCPEPESWPAVAAAHDQIPLPHPGRFTSAMIFRKCPQCRQKNLVKDDWFLCGVCGEELPQQWNFS